MNNRVEKYYDQNVKTEWSRLERHRTEFAVTMRIFQDYLPEPPATVLDVGGGPGRYAIALAQQEYRVTLVDLSQECLQFAKDKAKEARVELVDYVQANATNLEQFPDGSCDAVLLMGPLIHLLKEQEREKALRETRRVLRQGGVIFASFICRYAPLRYVAQCDPARILKYRDRYEDLLSLGILKAVPNTTAFTDAHFAHPSEIKPFMEKGSFETLNLVGCEGIVTWMEDKVNKLTGELWKVWVELNYRLGKDPTLHGAADHLLYAGRRI